MPKRETKPSEFRKAKAGITGASVPYKLRCLRIKYPAINPSLCLKASLIGTTARKQRGSSITLALLLYLIKRPRLILLTFYTRLNISTLRLLYTPSEITNLDSLPLIYLHYTRIQGKRHKIRSH
jgi:hypothetical protein